MPTGGTPLPLAENPLCSPSTLPYGVPDFAHITDEHIMPAFSEALARHREEIEAIASCPEPPTPDNTVIALEKSGADLDRVVTYFFTLASADATEERLSMEKEISPQLAQHFDTIYLNRQLYQRVERCAANTTLTGELARLVTRYLELFVRRGAHLDDTAQQRLRDINIVKLRVWGHPPQRHSSTSSGGNRRGPA